MTGADIVSLIKKHPVGFGSLLVAILCGAVLYVRSSSLDEAAAASEQKSDEANRINQNLTNSANLKEQTESLVTITKDMDARIVRASQLADNLQYFYQLESATGVKILDVRQGVLTANNKGPKNIYSGVPFVVSVQGDFAQVMSFVRRLEHGRHFCRFLGVNVAPSGGGPNAADTGLLTVSTNLELLGLP